MKNSKLELLKKQFPVLATILKDYPVDSIIDTRVKIMDIDMLINKGEAASCLYAKSGKHESQIGKCKDKSFICSKREILHCHQWQDDSRTYFKDLFNYHSPYAKDDTIIIDVKQEVWHERIKAAENYHDEFGKKLSDELLVTVWKSPKEGVKEFLRKPLDLSQGAFLYDRDMMDSIIYRDGVYKEVADKIQTLINLFESQVYVPNLKSQIEASEKKGMSFKSGDIKLLSFVMCGRIIISIYYRDHEVSMLGLEDGFNGFGLHHVRATYPEIEYMFSMIVREASTIKMQDNARLFVL